MYIKRPLALPCWALRCWGSHTSCHTTAQLPALRDAKGHLAPQTAPLCLPRVREDSRVLLASWATASKVTHVLGRFVNSPTHASGQIP